MTAIQKRRKRLLSVIGTIFTVLGIGVIAVVALDYFRYSNYEPSYFFGSKDVYPQDRSLYFDEIKVTVSGVEHKEVSPKESDETCSSKYPRREGPNFLGRYESDVNYYIRSACLDQASKWENRKDVLVHYFIENLSDKPISIGAYSARIDGTNDIERNTPSPKIKNLLAKQSRYAAFWVEVPKGAGDFALVIAKNGKQKQINLQLPPLMKSE